MADRLLALLHPCPNRRCWTAPCPPTLAAARDPPPAGSCLQLPQRPAARAAAARAALARRGVTSRHPASPQLHQRPATRPVPHADASGHGQPPA